MAEPDPLRQLLAKHQVDLGVNRARRGEPLMDPEAVGRVFDVTLAVIGAAASSLTWMATALSLRRDRLGRDPGSTPRPVTPPAPTNIPIEF